MRLGGLGQLWAAALRLVSLMFLCQLLSPLVALLAIVVSGSEMTAAPPDLDTTLATPAPAAATVTTAATSDNAECCEAAVSPSSPCPSDAVSAPHLCQDPAAPCSALPLACVRCQCDYSCTYGQQAAANCTAHPQVRCAGDKTFSRPYTCSYCFLAEENLHRCSNRDIGKL